MGKVIMVEPGGRIPGVYAIENNVEYTYCDRCGSFSIEIRSSHPQSKLESFLVKLGLWLIVASIIWFFAALAFKPSWIPGCFIGLVGIAAHVLGTPHTFLKCRKCGNEHISDANALQYKADDNSVLDVPDSEIIKRHINTTVY